jgi:hypothetical protein
LETYNRGKIVTIEASVQRHTAFGAQIDYDPDTSVKITITDPSGSIKVYDEEMDRTTTGKYYYQCETEATWRPGEYACRINIVDGDDEDMTKQAVFELN